MHFSNSNSDSGAILIVYTVLDDCMMTWHTDWSKLNAMQADIRSGSLSQPRLPKNMWDFRKNRVAAAVTLNWQDVHLKFFY